ncbi:hypothetical protein NDU88_007058 [Pleurodeles waltl]|uniref:Uncharacterized protein n=1 Tax=Pleurodeles waltl TaxID=8319 RepID=A0AAV7RQJ7_PLEWA|nr:hypothetical protein NDU88_007058 [Pleurodeles waltl]
MGRTKGKHINNTGALLSENDVPPTPADPPMDKLDVILKDIRVSRLAIEQRLGSITTELSILKDDHRKLVDRVKRRESDVAALVPGQKDSESVIQKLQKQVETLQERIGDAKGRSHRNNIRIIGLLEGTKGLDATQYVETWLRAIANTGLSAYFTTYHA